MLQVSVSSVSGMLQVFHMDVAKVDREAAYVAMVVHICCKLLLCFIYFQTYVASVFIWMLYMFHTYVCKCVIWMLRMFFVIVSSVFQVFLLVFQMHVSSVSFAFRHMLQVLHLNVLKVDWVLHISPRLLLPRLGVSPPPSAGWTSAVSSLSS
jgi:hypothetical protein